MTQKEKIVWQESLKQTDENQFKRQRKANNQSETPERRQNKHWLSPDTLNPQSLDEHDIHDWLICASLVFEGSGRSVREDIGIQLL